MKRISIIKSFLIISLLGLALAVSSCGGSDDTTSTSAAPSTGAQETTSGAANDGSADAGGSSDSGDSGSIAAGKVKVKTSSRPKAEFIKLANSICKRDKTSFLPEIGTYVQENISSSGSDSNQAFTAAVQAVVLPKIEREIEEIRMLGVSPSEAKQVEAFLAALGEGVNKAAEDSPSASPEGSAGSGSGELDFSEAGIAEANAQFTKAFQRSALLARKYGVVECAYG
jgi:hypothetical protein